MRRARAAALALLGAALSAAVAPAAEAPARPTPLDARFRLGIGTHQGLGEAGIARGYVPATAIAQMRALGLNSFRDDLGWGDFLAGPRRGGLGERLARLEAQVAGARLAPMLILNGGAPQVPDSTPPTTDAARRAFGTFAADAAAAVRPLAPGATFEVWNEWNIAARANPAFDLDTYAALLRAVASRLRRAEPPVRLIAGAVGDDLGWRWGHGLIDRGGLTQADGLSVHLYNHCAAPWLRTAAEVIARLKDLHRLTALRTGDPLYPLYATEVGWTNARGQCHVTEARAADNVAQTVLWAATMADWLKGVWFYELKDSGTNPDEMEDNFGLYRFDDAPKPAVCALKGAWAFARDSLEAREERPFEGVTLVRLRAPGEGRIALWSGDPRAAYAVRVRDPDPGLARAGPCDPPAPVGQGWMPVGGTPLLLSHPAGARAPDLEFRREPAR